MGIHWLPSCIFTFVRCLTHPINGSEVLLLHHIKSPISTTEPHVDNSTSRWILQLNPVSLDVFLRAFNHQRGELQRVLEVKKRRKKTPGNGRSKFEPWAKRNFLEIHGEFLPPNYCCKQIVFFFSWCFQPMALNGFLFGFGVGVNTLQ